MDKNASPKRGRRRPRYRRKQRSRQPHPTDVEAVARARFGVARLYAEQRLATEALLAGNDVLAVLPTGFGKSLIYQVAAMLLDGATLVISPLLALMRDQERHLRQLGVPVVRLDSTVRGPSRRQALARIQKGGRLIVLTTPETLASSEAHPALAAAQARLFCVDEAHCISEWGHDFRPAYLRLAAQRDALRISLTLALTATATPRVQSDIIERLRMRNPRKIVAPPHRANLRLAVMTATGGVKLEVAGQLIRRCQRPAVIYCATTKAVDEIFGALSRARVPCARYHGRMSARERTAAQRRFMQKGRQLVMVATSAFGMGIDKPNIRSIIHFQVPGSLEQYVQEAGRAGRDGKPADCILLFDRADLAIQRFLQRASHPSGAQMARVTEALVAWLEEGKRVTAKELALSASVPLSTTRALATELEELGLLTLDTSRHYSAVVPLTAIRGATRDLAARLQRQRIEDERRLRGIEAYADTSLCRSAFIRAWFGEQHPPPCGHCDNCRARQAAGWSDTTPASFPPPSFPPP